MFNVRKSRDCDPDQLSSCFGKPYALSHSRFHIRGVGVAHSLDNYVVTSTYQHITCFRHQSLHFSLDYKLDYMLLF